MGSCFPARSLVRRTELFTSGLFLLSTAMFIMTMTSSAISARSTGHVGLSIGLPASRFFSDWAKSMTFVTRSRSRAAQLLTMPSCRLMPLPAGVSSKAVVRPSMPWSGLRISCESIAMSADFRSWTILSSATSLRSWPIPRMPPMRPSSLLLGTKVMHSCLISVVASPFFLMGIEISTSCDTPSDALPSMPTPSLSSPPARSSSAMPAERAASSAFSTPSLQSADTTSSSGLPCTSSWLQPVSECRFSFHSKMHPSRSSRKTGTFALWMREVMSLPAARAATHQRRMEWRSCLFRSIASSAP
mmetsp:Transcript_86220/g.224800  ORF Transcript_86220/g.224800 Transcript_86220/m.224800 type:complete len:302 (+) Transcript_86220:225-1130(+)